MSNLFPHLGVVGSRSFNDYEYLHSKLHEVIDSPEFQSHSSYNSRVYPSMIISGGAKGADKLAERFAYEHQISVRVYHPDWDKHGRSAGFKRNKEIVDDSDVIVAFWDGESKGTKHSIDLAVKQNKQVIIYTDWKEQ